MIKIGMIIGDRYEILEKIRLVPVREMYNVQIP